MSWALLGSESCGGSHFIKNIYIYILYNSKKRIIGNNHTTLTLTFRLVNDKKIGAIRYTVL